MAKKANKGPANGNGSAAVGSPYFLSISLENARCFAEKQTLKLHDEAGRPARWTIILGNNGTGKTTILRALAAFQTLYDLGRWSSLEEFDSFGRASTSTTRLEAEFATPLGSQRWESPKEAGWVHIQHEMYADRTRPSPAEALTTQSQHVDVEAITCFAYGAGRRLAPASMSRPEIDDPVANLFNDAIPLRNAEEWLLQLDYSASKPSPIQKRQRRRLEQVRQLLLHILPEVDDIRLSEPSEQQPTPRVEFQTPYGWVHLRALGYGYQTLLAWMVDLASRLVERYPDSPDPLAEPAVVLVDEIDLHLHPQWQRKLIGHLTERFPNTQFIVTAHSPLVVQAAGDANLAVLRREGDHVVIDNDVQSVRGWRVDQIYTSELFGLPTARPPEVEALLLRRRELLEKPTLSEKDKRELAELELKIGELPAGESAEQIDTLRLIKDSLDLLKKSVGTKQ